MGMDVEYYKNKIYELLDKIERDGFDKERLKGFLDNSDFFTSPFTAKYQYNEECGLVKHTLDTYRYMSTLVDTFPELSHIPNDSIIITSLFHSISKINCFEQYAMNKKVYSENGSKYDNLGRFDWVSEMSYKLKDIEDRLVFGTKECESEYIARQYIPLTMEETIAIQNYNNTTTYDIAHPEALTIYSRFTLCFLLHIADAMASNISGRDYDE